MFWEVQLCSIFECCYSQLRYFICAFPLTLSSPTNSILTTKNNWSQVTKHWPNIAYFHNNKRNKALCAYTSGMLIVLKAWVTHYVSSWESKHWKYNFLHMYFLWCNYCNFDDRFHTYKQYNTKLNGHIVWFIEQDINLKRFQVSLWQCMNLIKGCLKQCSFKTKKHVFFSNLGTLSRNGVPCFIRD